MTADFKFMLEYANYLKDSELTDIEKLLEKLGKLGKPTFFADLLVVMALEKADNDKDKKNFHAILRADGAYKAIMIKKHIDKILSILENVKISECL